MAVSNLVPSITAAHADLFVPADSAISLPHREIYLPHHLSGTSIINRPVQTAQSWIFASVQVCYWHGCKTNKQTSYDDLWHWHKSTENATDEDQILEFYFKVFKGKQSWPTAEMHIIWKVPRMFSSVTSGFAVYDYFCFFGARFWTSIKKPCWQIELVWTWFRTHRANVRVVPWYGQMNEMKWSMNVFGLRYLNLTSLNLNTFIVSHSVDQLVTDVIYFSCSELVHNYSLKTIFSH